MPTINADEGGDISIVLKFDFMMRKLQRIEQKLDQILRKLDEIEEKCGGGSQMGGRAGKTRGHEMG